ncbi:MAG TPA: ketoacyl-ACP synthase III [Bacteroidetes bacterium]|nr:ketoacyl-ACP synthase III [Bacteroidota bacterium]
MDKTSIKLGSAKILSTGSYLPEKVRSNAELVKVVPFDENWIISRTGIETRRVAAENENTSDLATNAAQSALSKSGIEVSDIDLIIVATITPDRLLPSTASIVREKLGANNAVAFDLNGACSGFIFALNVAEQFIRTGAARYALVIVADTLTLFVTSEDPKNYILFGDGAGAALICPEKVDRGIKGTLFGMDTQYPIDWLTIPLGAEFVNGGAGDNGNNSHFQMNGREIFRWAVKTVPTAIGKCLERCGTSLEEIKLIIPHQANLRIISAIADKMNLPMEKFMVTINKYGNTSAASIPIALDEAIETGKLKPGDLFMLVGFGGGLAWGISIITL